MISILIFVFLVIILYLSIHQIEHFDSIENKIQQVNQKPKNNRTIFVSIASYRDKDCSNTLNSIFEEASNPNNIYVGICQQNNQKDPDCFNPKYKNNIRIIRFNEKEAKGPTYARFICSKLYDNEDYYVQIDSHTRFVKNWDSILIDMLPQKKAVLTTYPNDINTLGKGNDVSILCNPKFEDNMISFRGLLISPPDNLIESGVVTGGFFFTYGAFLEEVPFDGDLPHLFLGEEVMFSVRLWTNGWDFYAPNKRICYHYYTRSEDSKYWENPDYQKYQPLSFQKVQYFLKLTDKMPENIPLGPGLGTKRSLEDYYEYIGFNVKDRTFNKKFCKGFD